MKKLHNESIDDYDELDDDAGGTLKKKFIRIDSENLKHFLREASKKKCTYRTHLGDFVRENFHDGHLPLRYISTLIKNERNNSFYDRNVKIIYDDHLSIEKEQLCSRIANKIFVPTVYNLAMYYNEQYGKSYCNMSIDYLQPGEETISLDQVQPACEILNLSDSDLDFSFYNVNELSDIEVWLNYISKNFYEVYNDNYFDFDENIYNEMETKILKEFVKQYFVKKYLFQDNDFKPRNVSIIHNTKTKQFELAPMLDYEFCFENALSVEFIYHDLKLSRNSKYRDIILTSINELMTGFHNYFVDKDGEINSKRIETIISDNISDEYNVYKISNIFNENFRSLYASFCDYLYNDISHYSYKDLKLLGISKESL